MENSRSVVVAVAGGGRDSGKTALVCSLLEHFSNAAAIKCAHRGAGGPGVSDRGEDAAAEGKDTGRMKRAGAKKVVLVRAGDGALKNKISRALAMVKNYSPVIIEGAAAFELGKPDLKIFVEKNGGAEDKAGSAELKSRVHLVVSEKNLNTEKISLMIRKLMKGRDGRVLQAALKRTRRGIITCAAARKAAADMKIPPAAFGRLCNQMGIRMDDCVLGCFGKFKEKKTGKVAVLGGGLVANQKVWIEKKGRLVMGEGRAKLLRAIKEEGSINRGAGKCGLSYRRAWAMIHSMEERTGRKIMRTSIGGHSGGGSSITSYGNDLLKYYEKLSFMSQALLEEEMK